MVTLSQILEKIDSRDIPPVILVGGDNEYLVDEAFTSIRDRLVASGGFELEPYSETADLGAVLDSFRTMSLFGGKRLLAVPEVNAFVTKKEVSSLYDKAASDWTSAKTDRKRSSSVAKLLHILGLLACDLEQSDQAIAEAMGEKKAGRALSAMLEFARTSGKKVTRGEADASLLAEAVSQGGAPGAVLLLRSGDVPRDSATVRLIEARGAVVICDLTREQVPAAIDEAIRGVARDCQVTFQPAAITALKRTLGIDRILADKYAKDVPDVRIVVSEAERLATFAGVGGVVTPAMVEQQIQKVAGGIRYEFATLYSERKPLEAIAKLRDLIAQARREEPKTPMELHYGRFIFPLADEVRQLLAILAFARMRNIDVRKPMQYNRFKDLIADPLGEYLKANSLVRQKPHPFPLHKKFEVARLHSEASLFRALSDLAELDFSRKSGGVPTEVGLETIVLAAKP
ncbi:MAG TPA: hypothetical protein VMS12_09485 [Thermoanaerobaculia bacterium]|nr:hypothetical protein [Thermoanaerobaculia bacterium]